MGVEAEEKGQSQKVVMRYVKYFCYLMVKPIQISRGGALLMSILANFTLIFKLRIFLQPRYVP